MTDQEKTSQLSGSSGTRTQISSPKHEDQSELLTGSKLVIVFSAMLLSSLLFALDQTILSTALPRIASDFNAFSLQGWVADSFILAQTVFILIHGKLLRIFPAKWILLSGILVFEIGSLVCGVAHNVGQIIAGRAVSGAGAAAIFVGMIQVIAQATRPEARPRLFGIFGAVFGLASVIGPLLGGVFTDKATWRWCFFINLPIGGLSFAVVTFALPAAPPLGADFTKRSPKALLSQVLHMDLVGATIVSAAVTCIVLALQWGGNTKPWDDAAVIVVSFSISIRTEIHLNARHVGDNALVPMSLFKSRSVYGAVAFSFLTRFSLLLFSYYIPIFYQAAKHSSAINSGIDLLPFILSVATTSLLCGQLVSLSKYYWPFLAIAPIFLGLGSGLLYSLETNTPEAHIIGFQILAGIGTGFGMQNSLLALQVEFRDTPALVGQATSLGSFAQARPFLGGTLALGVAEPVFASQLSKYLRQYAPDAPLSVVQQSPTSIYSALPADMVPGVVRAYTASLKIVFLIGVPIAFLALVSAAFINNLRIVQANTLAAQKDVEGAETV
ncbi:putative transporter [Mycena epipterygia]|nr:putative transporter [Mycena epipterygia]